MNSTEKQLVNLMKVLESAIGKKLWDVHLSQVGLSFELGDAIKYKVKMKRKETGEVVEEERSRGKVSFFFECFWSVTESGRILIGREDYSVEWERKVEDYLGNLLVEGIELISNYGILIFLKGEKRKGVFSAVPDDGEFGWSVGEWLDNKEWAEYSLSKLGIEVERT